MHDNILVVDDDENVLDILSQSLNGSGYNVQTASYGKDAIMYYKARKPDMVVLDMMLPDIDGREVLRRLRSMDDGGCPPVLFLSANSDIDLKLRGLEDGAEDYLVKPFSLREVNNKIIKALDRAAKNKVLEKTKKLLEPEVDTEQENYAKLNIELKKQR